MISYREPLELNHMEYIQFICHTGSQCFFYFTVDKECVVTIKYWPLDDVSDCELYIGIDNEELNRDNCDFMSDQVGADEIRVKPNHVDYKRGLWRVAINPNGDDSEQRLAIELHIKEVNEEIELSKSLPL